MNLTAIRTALAAQVTAQTGLRCDPEARDSISPPAGVVLPGSPVVDYATSMDGCLDLALTVLILLPDGPPAEVTQAAMNDYLGVGAGQGLSIAAAVAADPTIGGTCQYAVAVSATAPGRLDYNGVTMWGSRVQLSVGAI